MHEYINKDIVISTILDLNIEHRVSWKDAVIDAVDEIATADVVERKRGKWVRENIVLTSNPPQYQWHCSECGKMVHWFTTEVLTNFCPYCGADMREESDNAEIR